VLLGYRRADVDAALDAADERDRVATEELASRAAKLDELERVANRLAERVVERERELKEVRAELAEATRKSALSMEALEALVQELERARPNRFEPAPAQAPESEPAPVDVPESEPVPAASNGHSEEAAARMFEGCVEVEIGPLGDFAQLVGFEDAAREIDATSEISILRFSDGRATLEMTLDEPVELLEELERRCAMGFRVRDNRDGRIVLDVD
jgi:hypothetical protein